MDCRREELIRGLTSLYVCDDDELVQSAVTALIAVGKTFDSAQMLASVSLLKHTTIGGGVAFSASSTSTDTTLPGLHSSKARSILRLNALSFER